MIGTSLPSYALIIVSITLLRLITPLSIFYCAFSIADPPSSPGGRFLLTWSAIETAFWLLVFFPRKRTLQAAARHPPPLDRDERRELYWRCWERIPNPEWYVNRWFLGARIGEVRRENLREFFKWALLNRGDEDNKKNKTRSGAAEGASGENEEVVQGERRLNGNVGGDDTDVEEQEVEKELDEYVDGVQTLLGRRIEPGRGPAKSLRLTVDAVNMLHRPFLWYMMVMIVDTLTAAYLRYNGFHLHRTPLRSTLSIFPPRIASLFTRKVSPAPDISYWYRPHTSKTRLPILFIHGIGIGLFPYTQFLSEITKQDTLRAPDGDIGILAIELLPISFRITSPIPSRESLVSQINAILSHQNIPKCVLATHSYGSVLATHLLRDSAVAPKIGPILSVDPVTFLLHLPDVAYNFTARKPRQANEHQLYYFASADMMVAHTLARHFFWAQNVLWKEDLAGRDTTVSLGGRDLIVDTETVGKYLNGVDLRSEDSRWKGGGNDDRWLGSGLETLWWPTCDHAQVFERREGRRRLGVVLRRYAESGAKGEEEEELA